MIEEYIWSDISFYVYERPATERTAELWRDMLSLNRNDFKERAGVGDACKHLTLCDPVFFTTQAQYGLSRGQICKKVESQRSDAAGCTS